MSDDALAGSGRRRLANLASALALVAATFALAWLVRRNQLGWLGQGGVLLFLMVGTVVLIRTSTRRMKASGYGSPALARYNGRMLVSGLVYMATFFGATYGWRELHWSGPALWLAAFASSLGVLGMIWAMARLVIEETDEYLRFRAVKAFLVGTAGLLLIATVWGFLEQFGLVPHVQAWAAAPVFAIMMGLGNCLPWVRA